MRIGINVNTRVPLLYPERAAPADVLDLAARVEALGYDAVWVGDNFLSKPRLEAVTTLAAVAARTTRVRLGTAALLLPLRHTAWFAVTWATLDQLSGGRTVLNVSVGGGGPEIGGPAFLQEYEVAGERYGRRGRRLEEQITLLRRLWAGDRVTVAGEFHDWREVETRPLPAQRPAPPIWITSNPQLYPLDAGRTTRLLDRVGRLADGWMTACATPAEFRAMWQRIGEAAVAAGRDPARLTAAWQLTASLDPDRDRARRTGLEFLNVYYGSALPALDGSFWDRDAFGTPAECVERMAALAEAGVREFSVRFASPDQRGQLELFTEAVWPRLRRLAPAAG